MSVDSDDLSHLTDAELVERSLHNRMTFGFLIDRYEAKLFRYIMRITNATREDAEDILQDVFLKVYQNLRNFDQKLSFSSWVYRICYHQVVSNHRKNTARAHGHSVEVEDWVIENIASDFNLEEEVERTFLKSHVHEILEKTPEKHRQILVLKYFEDMSYEEIADVIKKPPAHVGTLLARARKACQKVISKIEKT